MPLRLIVKRVMGSSFFPYLEKSGRHDFSIESGRAASALRSGRLNNDTRKTSTGLKPPAAAQFRSGAAAQSQDHFRSIALPDANTCGSRERASKWQQFSARGNFGEAQDTTGRSWKVLTPSPSRIVWAQHIWRVGLANQVSQRVPRARPSDSPSGEES
jgi:hypothetical protein